MDRDAMVRAVRRRQALEALEFERSREAELAEQLEERVAELEGDRVDEQLFAQLAPEDAVIVRGVLGSTENAEDLDFGTDYFSEPEEHDPAAERAELEEEAARLQAEIVESQRRQRAFEHYLELLGTSQER